MRNLRITAAKKLRSQWICRGRLQQSVRPTWPTAQFSTTYRKDPGHNVRRRIIWATVGGSLAIGAITSFQDIKHGTAQLSHFALEDCEESTSDIETGAAVVQRSARVVGALLLNVNE